MDHIILHHCATTNMDAVLDMMVSGSRQVSSNYVVKDGRRASVVPEEYRSWSVGDAPWDSRAITFEIANEASGEPWPVSAASHESVALLVADIAGRYGIPLNRDRILGHRELWTRYRASYQTSCPGGLDMDWIVNRAIQITTGSGTNGDDDMRLYERGVNSGRFGLGWGGGWLDVDNAMFPINVRGILTQAFGAPIQQFPADYDGVRLLHLKTASQAGGVDPDALGKALAASPAFVEALAKALPKAPTTAEITKAIIAEIAS